MTQLVAQLLEAVGRLPEHRFAVIDGACCANLPSELRARGLKYRCLYLRGSDVDDLLVAPYLVRVPTYQTAQEIIALIGDQPTGVFWSDPRGMDPLFAHLRKLNVVRIASVDSPRDDADYDTVLFRHGDCAVLGSMLSVMDPAQRSEFFGGTMGVAFGGSKWGQVSLVQPGR
jgi:hypothetical protein